MLSPGQDMAGRFLVQQKSSADLEQYLQQCKEKQQALKETLRKLELEHAELKFHQPPNTLRCCWPWDSRASWATTLGEGTWASWVSQQGPLPPSRCSRRPPLLWELF